MLRYTVVTKDFHYDNCEECNENMRRYENNGYKIISCTSEYDWSFVAEKRYQKGTKEVD